MNMRSKRSALGLALLIIIVFLQQASASAFNICSGSSTMIRCHCCQSVTLSNSKHGKTAIGKEKSAACKAKLQASWQKFGIATFKKTTIATDPNQIAELSSTSQSCCQIGKSETEIPNAIISTVNPDVADHSGVEIDSNNITPPLSHAVISHLHSRPVYLFLSSLLI
jgi:hypothetical protein